MRRPVCIFVTTLAVILAVAAARAEEPPILGLIALLPVGPGDLSFGPAPVLCDFRAVEAAAAGVPTPELEATFAGLAIPTRGARRGRRA